MELLGAAWERLGAAWGGRGAVWEPLGQVLGHLETVVGSSWSRLEVLRGGLGAFCDGLGVSWGGPAAVLSRLGIVLGRLGASWCRLEVPLGAKKLVFQYFLYVFLKNHIFQKSRSKSRLGRSDRLGAVLRLS